jgi:MoxR-like ATPase
MLNIGYPDEDQEFRMMVRFEKDNPLERLCQVTSPEEILKLRDQAKQVYIEDTVRHYILDIIRETRRNACLSLGASPRASLALSRASQSLALIKGRDFVIPEDVKSLVVPVLSHRIILSPESFLNKTSKEKLLEGILESLPVPLET